VTCDEVHEQLAEHLLGTLEPRVDAEVQRHLRGCAGCRRDMAALAEGVSTLALAAHDVEPPEALHDRTLSTLDDEWTADPAPVRGLGPRMVWLGRAAVVVALASALAWGAIASSRASRFEAAAHKYEAFLGILGGENVRVGQFDPSTTQQFTGSVVMYDSTVEQSWVLVLVRAPGMQGAAHVTLRSDDRTIELRPIEFESGGEASTWLVTSSNLKAFDRVSVSDDTGLIATATLGSD
jgi:hypothetical protein